MRKMFKELCVLELASVLAGPAVGMFFAELGAKVIKVENARTNGDVTRSWRIAGESRDHAAAYFYSVNYAKEHIFLDLQSVDDRVKLYDMLYKVDIVVSNYSEAVANKLGVAYAQIKKINDKIIFAQLDGFANYSSRPAYDIVLQAETGFLSMSGTKKGELTRMPVALIDIIAGHQLKEAILIALWKKERDQVGSFIKTSLEECAIASLANQATNYLMVGKIPVPMGTQHPNIAPYGDIFKTKDNKPIVLAIGTDKQFQAFCKILNKPNLATNALYITNEKRVKNRGTLNTLLSYSIAEFSADDLLSFALTHKVPIGLVKNLQEVFESSTAKDMIMKENHGKDFQSLRVKTFPVTIENNSNLK